MNISPAKVVVNLMQASCRTTMVGWVILAWLPFQRCSSESYGQEGGNPDSDFNSEKDVWVSCLIFPAEIVLIEGDEAIAGFVR